MKFEQQTRETGLCNKINWIHNPFPLASLQVVFRHFSDIFNIFKGGGLNGSNIGLLSWSRHLIVGCPWPSPMTGVRSWEVCVGSPSTLKCQGRTLTKLDPARL